MKKIVINCAFITAAAMLLLSCVSFTHTRSWGKSDPEGIKIFSENVTVHTKNIDSCIENEAKDLLPLLLSEKGFLPVKNKSDAELIMTTVIREKEYESGWDYKKSLAVEIIIISAIENETEAAGLATLEGNDSLDSSQTLLKLLEKAIDEVTVVLTKSRQPKVPE